MSNDGRIRDHFRRAYYENERAFVQRQGSTVYVADGFIVLPLDDTHPLFEEACYRPLFDDAEPRIYSPDRRMRRSAGPNLIKGWEQWTTRDTTFALKLTPWLYEESLEGVIARRFLTPLGLDIYVQKAFLDLLGTQLSYLEYYTFRTTRPRDVIVAYDATDAPVMAMMPLVWGGLKVPENLMGPLAQECLV